MRGKAVRNLFGRRSVRIVAEDRSWWRITRGTTEPSVSARRRPFEAVPEEGDAGLASLRDDVD